MPHNMAQHGMTQHDHASAAPAKQSASQSALEAQNASVSGDLRPALAALAKVNQNCVACHAAYKLK